MHRLLGKASKLEVPVGVDGLGGGVGVGRGVTPRLNEAAHVGGEAAVPAKVQDSLRENFAKLADSG